MKTYYEFEFDLLDFRVNNDGNFLLNVCFWSTADHNGELLHIYRSHGGSWDWDFLCIRQLWEQWRNK